jgi:hypothetical protein
MIVGIVSSFFLGHRLLQAFQQMSTKPMASIPTPAERSSCCNQLSEATLFSILWLNEKAIHFTGTIIAIEHIV